MARYAIYPYDTLFKRQGRSHLSTFGIWKGAVYEIRYFKSERIIKRDLIEVVVLNTDLTPERTN